MTDAAQTNPDPDSPDKFTTLGDIEAELTRLRISSLSPQQSYRVTSLYRMARDLDHVDGEALYNFFANHLLVDCLYFHKEGDKTDNSIHLHSLREILRGWLDYLPDSFVWNFRERLQSQIIDFLVSNKSDHALFALTTIGYRDENFVKCLLSVGSEDGDLGDLALRLLVSTRPNTLELDLIKHLLADRAQRMVLGDEGLNAVAMIGGDWAISQLHHAMKIVPPSPWDFARFSWVSEQAPGDDELQQRVWNSVFQLVKADAEAGNRLIFWASIAGVTRFRSGLHEILARVHDDTRLFVSPDRILGHLQKIDSLSQAESITSANASSLAHLLKPFAIKSSGPNDPGYTLDGYLKRDAWELSKLLGLTEMFTWMQQAVDEETNDYRKHNLMDEMAIYQVPTLPNTASSLLSDRNLTFDPPQAGSLVLVFLAASRLVASQSTFEALQLHLNANGSVNDGCYRSFITNAAELALWLYRSGDGRVLPVLFDSLKSPSIIARNIAVESLALIFELIPIADRSSILSPISEYAFSEAKPVYLKAEALSIVTNFGQFSASYYPHLVTYCESGPELIAFAAASALATSTQRANFATAINAFLARDFQEQKSISGQRRQLSSRQLIFLGRIAAIDPERYGNDAAAVIRDSFILGCADLLNGINDSRKRGLTVPAEVVDALVDRIYRNESAVSSSVFVVNALVLFDGDRFLRERWELKWQDWMADSRQAIADNLVDAAKGASSKLTDRSVYLARLLLADGVFAVRRSAARSLSILSYEQLKAVCEEWISSTSISLRCRACDLAEWLNIDDKLTFDNSYLRTLCADAERRVRSAAKRARDEIQKRLRADELVAHITKADTDALQWVLGRYAAGVALTHVGDDSHIQALQDWTRTIDLPPNVRHWGTSLIQEIDKEWKERTRKWPDPWLPWKGNIETLNGKAISQFGEHHGQYKLWYQPPVGSGELPDWGGVISLDEDTLGLGLRMTFGKSGDIEITISNRRPAKALVIGMQGGELVFSGRGQYPGPNDEDQESPVNRDP